jgi:hypothetical protein
MNTSVVEQATRAALPQSTLSAVVSTCLDISAVWSIDHEPGESCADGEPRRLLAFADRSTLKRLRAAEHLHCADIEFLVVVDGDVFASAWGPSRLSGSLARWAWRQTAPREAYYDESRWADGDGTVVRVRRKAFLVWQRHDPL